MNDSTNTYDLVSVRTLNASPQKVWEALSDSDLVKQWWGPRPFTCPVAEMDVREGGVSLVCMRAPAELGGMDIYNTWAYTKVQPFSRLEYTLCFSDKDGNVFDPAAVGMPAGIPKEVPHILELKEVNGKTELTFIEKGYTTPEAREQSKQGLEPCLDQMVAIFA